MHATSLRMKVLAAALVGVVLAGACGGDKGYGAPCDDGGGCESGACIRGTCGGDECRCNSTLAGPCPGDTGCPSGFACLGLGTGTAYGIARCFRSCEESADCPRAHVCEGSVCRFGDVGLAIAWANLPRDVPCRAGGMCPFEVKVLREPSPESYAWQVDDREPETTEGPRIELRLLAGAHVVRVTARRGEAEATLETPEDACVGAGQACDPGKISCCGGTCSAQLLCQ